MNYLYVKDLNNLKHDLIVDLATVTASNVNYTDCTSQFNFHADLIIDDQKYPVIVQGIIGSQISFEEDDYGVVVGQGVCLRELIYKDEMLHQRDDVNFSKNYEIVSDLLQKDQYNDLIVNHSGTSFQLIAI